MSAVNQYVLETKILFDSFVTHCLIYVNIFLYDALEVNLKETRTKIVSST